MAGRGGEARTFREHAERVANVFHDSLGACERDYWIEFRGAPRGQIASDERDGDEQQRDHDECRRIACAHPEEQIRNHARETEGTDQSDDNTDRGQRHALPNDQSQHIGFLRTERHANSDFMGALRDRVSHHAVDAERGEQERGTAEDRKELHRHAPRA